MIMTFTETSARVNAYNIKTQVTKSILLLQKGIPQERGEHSEMCAVSCALGGVDRTVKGTAGRSPNLEGEQRQHRIRCCSELSTAADFPKYTCLPMSACIAA
jgi:hypothetical protein